MLPFDFLIHARFFTQIVKILQYWSILWDFRTSNYFHRKSRHLICTLHSPKQSVSDVAEDCSKVNCKHEKNLLQQHKIHQKYLFASTEVSVLLEPTWAEIMVCHSPTLIASRTSSRKVPTPLCQKPLPELCRSIQYSGELASITVFTVLLICINEAEMDNYLLVLITKALY